MNTIHFLNGIDWNSIPQTKTVRLLRQDELVERLAKLTQDWQEAAQGKPLKEVKASVGLMLIDFAVLLELCPDEAQKVLGFDAES